MKRLLPVALLVGVGLTACGSTVPLAQQRSAASAANDALSAPGGAAADSAGTAAVGAGTGETGSTGPASGAPGSGSGSGGPAATTASRAGAATGAPGGVPAGPVPGAPSARVLSGPPIEVGITYVKDAGEGLGALGAGGSLGAQKDYAQVVIDKANAAGGLAGRKIVPVFFGYDVNPGSASYPQQDQSACATFTQDHHTELALVNLAGDNLIACLRKKGVPMVSEGSIAGVSAASLAAGGLYEVGAFNLDRRAVEQVKALRDQDWLKAWDTTRGAAGGVQPVKVGVVTYDLPAWRDSVKGPLTSALKAAGAGSPEVVLVSPHDSYDNLSALSTQVQAAVISFKSRGVTHVVVWDDNGVASLFFLKAADSQGYRPRYGINSGNNMNLLVGSGLVAKSQANGAVGMGWTPIADIPAAASPSSRYSNASRRGCNALMKAKGKVGSDYNEGFALTYCATFDVVTRAASALSAWSTSGFTGALDRLGSSYTSPITPATYLDARHHDGNGGIYHYAYDAASGDMVYRGGVIPLAR